MTERVTHTIEKNKSKLMAIILVILFLSIQLLFLLKTFTLVFIILLGLLLGILFMAERNRLFVWMTISFTVGLLAFIYGDRLILEVNVTHAEILILNRILLFLPIILVAFVVYKFNRGVLSFLHKPSWNENTKLPFIWSGFWELSVKRFFIIGTVVYIVILLILGVNAGPLNWHIVGNIFFFSILNGITIEFLWRSLFLAQIRVLIGDKGAVLVTSLSCAMFYYLLGFSLAHCLIFFVAGIFHGGITLRSNSLYPAMIWNICLTITFVFTGSIPLLALM